MALLLAKANALRVPSVVPQRQGAHFRSSKTWISTAHSTRALQLASGASLHCTKSL